MGRNCSRGSTVVEAATAEAATAAADSDTVTASKPHGQGNRTSADSGDGGSQLTNTLNPKP